MTSNYNSFVPSLVSSVWCAMAAMSCGLMIAHMWWHHGSMSAACELLCLVRSKLFSYNTPCDVLDDVVCT